MMDLIQNIKNIKSLLLSKQKGVKLFPWLFRGLRRSVRVKLVLIISSVIFVMLLSMIYLATYFFRADYELRIQEQNVKMAEIIGTNIEISLKTLRSQGRFLAKDSANRNLEQALGMDIAFFGLYKRSPGALEPIRQYAKQSFLKKNSIEGGELRNLIQRHQASFRRSFRGSTNIVNVSSTLKTGMVGLSFPKNEKSKGGAIVVLLCPIASFIDSFQSGSSGFIQTFMVDLGGKVLMHPDVDIMRAGANFRSLPIVSSMQKSRFRSGQVPYENKEGESYLGSFWKSSIAPFGIISTISEENAFAEVYNIQRRNFYLMIVAISVAVFAVLWYSRRLVLPIRKLTSMAREVAEGRYKVSLRVSSEDEIGVLTKSFNQMSKGLQERENLKDSFARFVNREIAEKSLRGQLKLGGERKEVALLFSDIRNFTSMSEKMRPEELIKFLNTYFTAMVGCIVRNRGTVDKYIGDAIMAHWGAVGSHKNPAEAAVRSALQMRMALMKFNQKRTNKIRFGVGVNYGPVVAGQIGSQERLEYTVIGDAVNTASRLEDLTKQLKVDILITDNTYQRIGEGLKVVPLGAIKVRGKEKAVRLYAVLGPAGDKNTPSGLKELRSLLGIKGRS